MAQRRGGCWDDACVGCGGGWTKVVWLRGRAGEGVDGWVGVASGACGERRRSQPSWYR